MEEKRDAMRGTKKRCEIYETQLGNNMIDVVLEGFSKRKIKNITKGQLLDVFEPILAHIERKQSQTA